MWGPSMVERFFSEREPEEFERYLVVLPYQNLAQRLSHKCLEKGRNFWRNREWLLKSVFPWIVLSYFGKLWQFWANTCSRAPTFGTALLLDQNQWGPLVSVDGVDSVYFGLSTGSPRRRILKCLPYNCPKGGVMPPMVLTVTGNRGSFRRGSRENATHIPEGSSAQITHPREKRGGSEKNNDTGLF
ncbi:hypothetical protein JTE90_024457 [Oedothorax gibbosus]|uniref:Uncharacterized protein n=1 Tax=Oedothorax gibbosus TaxID=931172 RepID=A0AAV6TL08_9ARAC|nr:hypothetical protein JTE90_024457 [Oedothorax gibbosus]